MEAFISGLEVGILKLKVWSVGRNKLFIYLHQNKSVE